MMIDTGLSTVDASPYFERVLRLALKEGLIDGARIEALKREGAKAIVQLAAYFGTANLRPELEAARTRLVTLVGLALEADSGGKQSVAARMLADKTLLALSKAGADRLRRLHALPTERTMLEQDVSVGNEKDFLAHWTGALPVTFARYLAESGVREKNQAYLEMAYWLAGRLGATRDELHRLAPGAESVVNSALLVLFAEPKPGGFFSGERFIRLYDVARKKRTRTFPKLAEWLDEAPPAMRPLIDKECERFVTEVLAVIRDTPAIEIYRDQERYSGLFFFDASSVGEITHHDKAQADKWQRITGGQGEHDDVLCAVLLLVATGLPPAKLLRKKDATQIWQNFRAAGFDDRAVVQFIENVVPFESQKDIRGLWDEDLGPDSRMQLDTSDSTRALAYLHETCRSSWAQRKG